MSRHKTNTKAAKRSKAARYRADRRDWRDRLRLVVRPGSAVPACYAIPEDWDELDAINGAPMVHR